MLIVVAILAEVSAPQRKSPVKELESCVRLHYTSGIALTPTIARSCPISMSFIWQFIGGTAVVDWSTLTALSTFI
jgi:hypothetical protein